LRSPPRHPLACAGEGLVKAYAQDFSRKYFREVLGHMDAAAAQVKVFNRLTLLPSTKDDSQGALAMRSGLGTRPGWSLRLEFRPSALGCICVSSRSTTLLHHIPNPGRRGPTVQPLRVADFLAPRRNRINAFPLRVGSGCGDFCGDTPGNLAHLPTTGDNHRQEREVTDVQGFRRDLLKLGSGGEGGIRTRCA